MSGEDEELDEEQLEGEEDESEGQSSGKKYFFNSSPSQVKFFCLS